MLRLVPRKLVTSTLQLARLLSVFSGGVALCVWCLGGGGGGVAGSFECLLHVTYVDLPILHSLAPVAMATRAVSAVTAGARQRIFRENGHTGVNPARACV